MQWTHGKDQIKALLLCSQIHYKILTLTFSLLKYTYSSVLHKCVKLITTIETWPWFYINPLITRLPLLIILQGYYYNQHKKASLTWVPCLLLHKALLQRTIAFFMEQSPTRCLMHKHDVVTNTHTHLMLQACGCEIRMLNADHVLSPHVQNIHHSMHWYRNNPHTSPIQRRIDMHLLQRHIVASAVPGFFTNVL